MHVITKEHAARVPCHQVDLLKYCVIVARGMNVSCPECTRWRKRGALWEQFLRQEKAGKHV
jgi:hypothetical protein